VRQRRLDAAAKVLILLAFAPGLLRCSHSTTAVRREPGLNVLLITVDTLRADAIGAYGNSRASTPSIDRLAAAGIRFVDAHAHSVTTLPSHANILSGKYPTDHGVRDNSGFRFPITVDTLATLLKARGYRTGAFVSGFPLDSRFGLDRGFDVYEDRFVDAQPRPAFLEQERRGTETVALARHWIDGGPKDKPYLCWVHLYEPHFPYAPPEPFASRFPNDPYLGEVAAADAALTPLVEPLIGATAADGSAQGQDSSFGRTLVVLTGDHGESLGEHGEATHGIFAYEATLRIPLIVFQPHLFTPRVVGEPVRHVDLLPTILDALAVQVPESLAGRSLLPVVAGDARASAPAAPIYFEALSGNLNRGWAPLRGMIRNRLKYIDLPVPELYDLQRDPDEGHNLVESSPQQAEQMRAILEALRPSDGRAEHRAETADARQRLRSLGYMTAAVTSPARYAESDDPKRLIGLDTLLQDVVRLYLAGDLPAALARCRELVDRRPTMAVSLLELAHLERERGNLPEAIAALRRAAALNPDDTQTMSLLAAYLTQAGRAKDAVDLLEPYSRREQPDLEVLTSRALALAAAGRPRDALSTLAQARRQDPSNAMLRVEAGTVYLMAGDRERAREEFEAALALNGNVARAHSSLGVIAAADGRADQAIAHWKQALNADPQEVGKLVAFGEFLRQSGHEADARPYFELFVASASPPRYAREIERARHWLAQKR
jgi:arylsulfatase A-like enzyme/predicted negative regulator of RcsB-dependent stress response